MPLYATLKVQSWVGCCTARQETVATHIKIFILCCKLLQFDWINRYTISVWLWWSPRGSLHLGTWSRQSVSFLHTVRVRGCLCHECNWSPLSNTAWHLVLTYLNSMTSEYISRFSVAEQIDCISSGKPFQSRRKRAGQKSFGSTFGVKWRQFWRYPSNFVTVPRDVTKKTFCSECVILRKCSWGKWNVCCATYVTLYYGLPFYRSTRDLEEGTEGLFCESLVSSNVLFS
jgi:hypothetical protein